MMGKINRKSIEKNLPWIIGISIFVLGFLSMFTFSVFYHGNEERDFWYYNAATYGDAISLPGMVIAAGLYVRKAEVLIGDYKKKKHKLICHIIAAIAGLIGIVMQISWLTGAHSNWTLLHRTTDKVICGIRFTMKFTVAGWWHAAFFVIAMSTIAYWFFRLLFIRMVLSRTFQSNGLMRILLYVFSFCSALYSELHFSDDLESRIYDNGYANNILIWFGAVFAILFVLYICIPAFCSSSKSIFVEIIPIFSGCLLAASVCDLILFHRFDWFVVISCALLSFSLSWISFHNKDSVKLPETSESLLYTVCFNLFLSNFIFAHGLQEDTWIAVSIAVLIMFLWPLIIYMAFTAEINIYLDPDNLRKPVKHKVLSQMLKTYMWCSTVIIFVIIIGLIRHSNIVLSQVLGFTVDKALSFPIILLATGVIKFLFEPVKEMDEKVTISFAYKTLKICQYAKILLLSIVCFIWLLKDIEFSPVSVGFKSSPEIILNMIFLAIILGVTVLASILVRKTENVLFKTVLSFLMALVIYAYLTIISISNFTNDGFSVIDLAKAIYINIIIKVSIPLFILLAISLLLQIVGVSLLIRQSFFANAYFIRGYEDSSETKAYGKRINCMSFVIMTFNIVLLFLVTLSSLVLDHETLPLFEIIQFFILLFIGTCVFPTLIYFAIGEKLPAHSLKIVNGNPAIEIAKDGMCAYFVYILAAGIPIYLIQFTEGEDTPYAYSIYSLIMIYAIYELLKMCINNNIYHFKKMIERDISKEVAPEEINYVKDMKKRMMNNLYDHLNYQDTFAFLAGILYSFVCFAIKIIFKYFKLENNKDENGNKLTFAQSIEKMKEYCRKEYKPDKDLLEKL